MFVMTNTEKITASNERVRMSSVNPLADPGPISWLWLSRYPAK
jgi:hypothetical protein